MTYTVQMDSDGAIGVNGCSLAAQRHYLAEDADRLVHECLEVGSIDSRGRFCGHDSCASDIVIIAVEMRLWGSFPGETRRLRGPSRSHVR